MLSIASSGFNVQLAILSPANGANLTWQANGTPVTVLAHATDTVDGPLVVSWTIDNTVQFSTFSDVPMTQRLPKTLGAHQIQAQVTDSQGFSASAAVSVNVTASPPLLSIASPADGATVSSGQPFALRAVASDPQDGDLPDAALFWSINGSPTGTGHTLVTSVATPGDATVTLSGKDSAGLSATVTHTIHVVPSTGGPVVVITAPADSAFFRPGATVAFRAQAQNADGSKIPDAAIVWSDEDGVLGTGAALDYVVPQSFLCFLLQRHVKVTVTGAGGKIASDTITLTFGVIC